MKHHKATTTVKTKYSLLFTSVLSASILLICLAAAWDNTPNEWENPQLVGQNRLDPHATMMIYPDAESAKKAEAIATQEDRSRSPWFASLNGDWKFRFQKDLWIFSKQISMTANGTLSLYPQIWKLRVMVFQYIRMSRIHGLKGEAEAQHRI
jgi:hypothetical protein